VFGAADRGTLCRAAKLGEGTRGGPGRAPSGEEKWRRPTENRKAASSELCPFGETESFDKKKFRQQGGETCEEASPL